MSIDRSRVCFLWGRSHRGRYKAKLWREETRHERNIKLEEEGVEVGGRVHEGGKDGWTEGEGEGESGRESGRGRV